jgi:hypothetical protein
MPFVKAIYITLCFFKLKGDKPSKKFMSETLPKSDHSGKLIIKVTHVVMPTVSSLV